jgi:putative phage-type endonuclease
MIELIQGSPEWHAARCGSLGASCLHEAVAKTKTGWGASRAQRMAILIIERLTGAPQESYQSPAMLHGIETEPQARAAYEFLMDAKVRQVGLFSHPTLKGTHASPDGLVDSDGVFEAKCPQSAAHLATLLGEPIPDKYIKQVQWQMRCCDRAWCDFVSYCPAFPAGMDFFLKRIERDDRLIKMLESDVGDFLDELEAKLAKLQSRFGGAFFENPVKKQLEASLA